MNYWHDVSILVGRQLIKRTNIPNGIGEKNEIN